MEQCEEEVKEMRINKLGIENKVNIEAAHRTNSNSNKSNKNKQRKPRTIAIDLHGYRIKILRNSSKLKDTNIFNNKDFSVKTLKKLPPEAYLQYLLLTKYHSYC